MSRDLEPELAQLALGFDPLDRSSHLRAQGWSAVPPTRALVLLDGEGRAAVRLGEDGSVRLALGSGAQAGVADDLMLGVDASGTAWCARVVTGSHPDVGPDAQWVGLRQVGVRLPSDERGILAAATALANWHRTHPCCPRCGAPTDVAGLGWWRTCPRDGSPHFPRTDPAIIALPIDDDDNALLGRQTRWPPGAFSTLAGFVEPGEAAEAAVVREIVEEVALRPDGVRYLGSQPWPFPASLMLGYHASIPGVRPTPTADGVEIAEARWLSRAEFSAQCEAREVRLPGSLSIAHHLIRRWYGHDLPEGWCRW